MRISAEAADAKVGGNWFAGYTSEVEAHEAPQRLPAFDAQARAEAVGDTEMVLFGAGLTVDGTLDLGEGVQSIVAVIGDLHAKRIILGEAVLVVTGNVRADEWIIGRESEGLFEVGGAQVESDRDALFARVHAPVVALYDRAAGELVVTISGARSEVSSLIPEVGELGRYDHDAIRRLDAENVALVRGA